MLKQAGIDKSTKCCELTVYLLTGVRVVGTYHISTTTSSAIRPSDALRDCKDGFVVLTDATIHENGAVREQGSLMIRMDAISHVDLPAKGWSAREGSTPAITPAAVSQTLPRGDQGGSALSSAAPPPSAARPSSPRPPSLRIEIPEPLTPIAAADTPD